MYHAMARPPIILTALLVSLAAASIAQAQDASAWDKESHAAARLIAGSAVKTANQPGCTPA